MIKYKVTHDDDDVALFPAIIQSGRTLQHDGLGLKYCSLPENSL